MDSFTQCHLGLKRVAHPFLCFGGSGPGLNQGSGFEVFTVVVVATLFTHMGLVTQRSALRLARLHRRIRNVRQDFLHKLAAYLAKTKPVIVVEDLNVSGMLRNRHLARHIADSGWGEFRRMLEYKCAWYGRRSVVANRHYPSSKTCSVCGAECTMTGTKTPPGTCCGWPNKSRYHQFGGNSRL